LIRLFHLVVCFFSGRHVPGIVEWRYTRRESRRAEHQSVSTGVEIVRVVCVFCGVEVKP